MAGAVVLDTCTLLWRAFEPQELSKRAARIINESERVIISSISFWEIGVKLRSKAIVLGISLADFVSRLEATEGVEILPVTTSIWIRNIELNWQHRDPADRTIVATAMENNCKLVTPDKEISRFYSEAVW